jgi:hypothetical protein
MGCSTKQTGPNRIHISKVRDHGHHYIYCRVIVSIIGLLNVKQYDEPVGFLRSTEAVLQVGVPRQAQGAHGNASFWKHDGRTPHGLRIRHTLSVERQCTNLIPDKEAR